MKFGLYHPLLRFRHSQTAADLGRLRQFKPRQLPVMEACQEKLCRQGTDQGGEHVPLGVPGVPLAAEEGIGSLAEEHRSWG